jgi:hypothetical protein
MLLAVFQVFQLNGGRDRVEKEIVPRIYVSPISRNFETTRNAEIVDVSMNTNF